jgi:hypothetical protein
VVSFTAGKDVCALKGREKLKIWVNIYHLFERTEILKLFSFSLAKVMCFKKIYLPLDTQKVENIKEA